MTKEDEERLARYDALEKEGRLVELPFPVGQKFYSYDVCWDGTTHGRTYTAYRYEYYGKDALYIYGKPFSEISFNCNEIGKKFFGTREEAEKVANKDGKMEFFLSD